MVRNFWLLAGALAVASPLFAQDPIPAPSQTAQGDVSVTIYNNDRALIEDKRVLDLPAGRSRQEFRDVSANIQPETVTLNGRGVGIVEQNFDFDLLSPTALMQNAVGQTVTLVRVNPATGTEVRERAKILAANGGETISFDVLPPAIGREGDEDETVAEERPRKPRRRTRAARDEDGDVAPAA